MSEDEKKKDVFIQEQIRKKPFYRRKCFQRTVRGTVAIVLLGVSAGGTFAFVQPLALQYRKEKDKMVVVSSETESETAAAEKVTETAAREEDLSNYEQVYIKMAAAADETKKTIVTLTGVTSELDLFNDIRESSRSVAGVIISKTDKDLLILTEKDTIDDTDSIKVTFEDGTLADAQIRGKLRLRLHAADLADAGVGRVELMPLHRGLLPPNGVRFHQGTPRREGHA